MAEYTVSVAVDGAGGRCSGGMIESAALTWRLREQPDVGGVIAMDVAPDQITGQIPQQPAGSVVQYQVKITFEDATELQYPENLADPFYEFFVGAVEEIYCTDFESDPAADGWTHGLSMGMQGEGADDWMWQEPLSPTSSGDPQAAFDGSRVFGNDLGGGNFNGTYQSDKTNFAESPVIDTTGYSQVRLQYRRWLNIEDGFFDRARIYANDNEVWNNFASPNMNDATTHHTDREWPPRRRPDGVGDERRGDAEVRAAQRRRARDGRLDARRAVRGRGGRRRRRSAATGSSAPARRATTGEQQRYRGGRVPHGLHGGELRRRGGRWRRGLRRRQRHAGRRLRGELHRWRGADHERRRHRLRRLERACADDRRARRDRNAARLGYGRQQRHRGQRLERDGRRHRQRLGRQRSRRERLRLPPGRPWRAGRRR
nr:hypothetical protein [Nannocystis pusilla]